MNFVAHSKAAVAKTDLYGDVYAIGSGKEKIRDWFAQYGASHGSNDLRIRYEFEAILGALGAANGMLLYDTGAVTERTDWGAYLQAHFFDFSSNQWIGSPSWFHTAFYFPKRNSLEGMGTVKNSLAYAPNMGDFDGLALINVDGDRCFTKGMVILDPLKQAKSEDFQWQKFRPQRVTISSIRPWCPTDWIRHRTLNLLEMSHVEFELTESTFKFKITDEALWNKLVWSGCSD